MEHKVPHDIGTVLAKKATVAAFDAYSKKYVSYSPTQSWLGDYEAKVTFNVKGLTLEGKIFVREKEIAMDLDVPFLLRPFKTKALDIIEREIATWCAKAKRGEL